MKGNTIRILFYAIMFSIVTATASQARDVTLQWTPGTDPAVTGYKIYYNAGSSAAPFTGTGPSVGASISSATVTGLDPSLAYYFAVTAYNAAGTVSAYSNIVSVAEAVPPTVSITAPAASTTISGTVSVTASATDNVGVTKVEYYLNGALTTTDTSTPYVYSLNTATLASGTYTLMAKAYDAAGNVGQSSNVSVSVVNDTTAPTVSLTAPANNATVSGTTTISANASDNVGVSKVEFYRSGVLLYSTNVAPYSYNWNTTSAANGSYTLTAKAYDNTGNVGQSANVAVSVNNLVPDTTAPTVSVTAPTNSATVSGTVSVAATASDNVGVSKVEFYINNALAATDTATPFTYSWNTTLMPNGTYSVMAKAYDAAGNVGQSASVTATVNNQVAAGTVTAVFGNTTGSNYPNTVADTFLNINNSVNATSTALNTYTWPASTPANAILMSWDLSALPANAQIQSATLSLYMTGSGGDAQYAMPVSGIINKLPVIAKSNGNTYDGTNAWTASSVPYGGVPLAQSDIAPAVDTPVVDTVIGYKSWNVTNLVKDWVTTPGNNKGLLLNSSNKASADSSRVFASSEAANAGQRPKLVVTYTLASASDTTAPTVAITAPASSTTVSGTVAASVAASDNVAVTKVEFYVNGALQATDAASPYTFSWNTLSFANGAYSLTAKAYDAAGNVGQSSTVNVTVNNGDTTAPVISLTSPASGATVSGAVTVASSSSDNVAVTKVEFYVNGALQATVTTFPYTFSWNTLSFANGAYSLTAKAYDAAGNVGQSAAVNVTVNNDTTVPVTSIASPTGGATVSGSVAVASSASDNVAVTKVELYVNGVLQATDTVSPYSFTWNTTSLANGSYVLTTKAYDAAGNMGQSSAVNVTVKNGDTTAPLASITSPAGGTIVSGSVAVASSASDNVAVTKVEFNVNGVLQATDTASPYSFTWNTTSLANGSYVLTTKAYDAAGNVGQSASVTVTVKNTVTAVFGNASGANYTNTIEDTFININNNVNATSGVLSTYTWPAYKPANTILMKCNVSALPANAQIVSATLSLYMTGSGGDALYEMPVSEMINKLPVIAKSNGYTYDGTNAWTASSVPYNGIPLAQSDIAPAVAAPLIDKTNGYKNWDVTSIVKDWVATPGNNKGVLVNASSKATADSNRVFASSEAVDATQRPKLVVTYVLP